MFRIIVAILLVAFAIWALQTFWPLLLLLLAACVAFFYYRRRNYLKTPAEDIWRTWDASADSIKQHDRMIRAETGQLTMLKIDKDKRIATFVGASGNQKYLTTLLRCTCPDFTRRGVPCKHMYKLASELGLDLVPPTHE